ncbi:aminoglycoside adenylyltransferase family protein [Kitasatospora purpeofusca]|uniref:aminoglycoside adenylyltransferase family protein n=1 Tax=Kitasatospora purpeofusca TaxID=67352 RepID=UPI00225819C4|nr:aminoglycoside adenylyltransferase family protein [Kitasatospora purpeofusca]MCX4755443.1 aminoglycoside adenylyltransferase family protein [Kitasatospora purpeofusca]WSR36686.1 aminoglycoside adenylyltransferase family protein [Kitasatospora purpeofusca]
MNQLREIVALADGVLGRDVVGVYLHGSAVLGGLRPASDLDVLLVVRRSPAERERSALLGGLLGISGSGAGGAADADADADGGDGDGARPVELAVVVQSEVRPWRYPPVCDFLYGEWLRADYEAGSVPRPEPMPDLALLITMVLAGDRPLAGPPPARVLDPVPHADLVRASTAGLPGLLDDLEGDTRNVLLTLARIWSTLATGRISSKDTAADWALARLPPEHRPVLAHARRLYLDCRYSEESWSGELRSRVRPHADRVLAEIDRLSPGSGPR